MDLDLLPYTNPALAWERSLAIPNDPAQHRYIQRCNQLIFATCRPHFEQELTDLRYAINHF